MQYIYIHDNRHDLTVVPCKLAELCPCLAKLKSLHVLEWRHLETPRRSWRTVYSCTGLARWAKRFP